MRTLNVKETKKIAGGDVQPLSGPSIPPQYPGISWWEWEELKRRLQQQR